RPREPGRAGPGGTTDERQCGRPASVRGSSPPAGAAIPSYDGAGDATASAGTNAFGRTTVNRVPVPTLLSTMTSPFNAIVSCLTRYRPRPTPPTALVIDESACQNGSKRCSSSVG